MVFNGKSIRQDNVSIGQYWTEQGSNFLVQASRNGLRQNQKLFKWSKRGANLSQGRGLDIAHGIYCFLQDHKIFSLLCYTLLQCIIYCCQVFNIKYNEQVFKITVYVAEENRFAINWTVVSRRFYDWTVLFPSQKKQG